MGTDEERTQRSESPGADAFESQRTRLSRALRDLSYQIWATSAAEETRAEFLLRALRMIRESSGCERVHLRLHEPGRESCFEATRDGALIMPHRAAPDAPKRTPGRVDSRGQSIGVPVEAGTMYLGTLRLESSREGFFAVEDLELYEALAQTLGLALSSQHAQVALRERVKELTCLYSLVRLADRTDLSLHAVLQGIAELLPPAWQYPQVAVARVELDGRTYATVGFREGAARQSADIRIVDNRRGRVDVCYTEITPELEEEPFLPEERNLIEAVAREIGLLVEQRQAEEEKERLQAQLRHADRLVTIGQVAAGVAHELNEPLGNILGFAQLALKQPGLPASVAADLDRIVNASLHAREIIKKLLLFARQAPAKKTHIDLNQIVEEGLYLFESRCAKEGVEVVRELAPDLPRITADPSQLHQILVNLVVNALQAMPGGGRITIRTCRLAGQVGLIVEDTGTGMSADVLERVFIPFFTTKRIGQGTGLGLPVVHGIVTEHGGTIDVRSTLGQGSRFEIRLPAGRLEVWNEVPDDGRRQ